MSIVRISPLVSVVAALVSLFGCGSASAEFMDCSGSMEFKEQISKEVVTPGPNRELGQVIRVWRISSKSPEFNGTEDTVYMHLDDVNGTGTHSGYWVLNLKSGEKLRAKFEGAHFTIMEAGRWETAFQGVFHFIAGTGKYEAIRGGGYYRGVEKSSGMTQEYGCSASY